MDIYSLVQKLPEELVGIIASYDPTKELRRKQLKKSFDDIHRGSFYMLNIDGHARPNLTIYEVFAMILRVIDYDAFHHQNHMEDVVLYQQKTYFTFTSFDEDGDGEAVVSEDSLPKPLKVDGKDLAFYATMWAGFLGGINGNIDIFDGLAMSVQPKQEKTTMKAVHEMKKFGEEFVKYMFSNMRKLKMPKQKTKRPRRNRSFCRRRRQNRQNSQ